VDQLAYVDKGAAGLDEFPARYFLELFTTQGYFTVVTIPRRTLFGFFPIAQIADKRPAEKG